MLRRSIVFVLSLRNVGFVFLGIALACSPDTAPSEAGVPATAGAGAGGAANAGSSGAGANGAGSPAGGSAGLATTGGTSGTGAATGGTTGGSAAAGASAGMASGGASGGVTTGGSAGAGGAGAPSSGGASGAGTSGAGTSGAPSAGTGGFGSSDDLYVSPDGDDTSDGTQAAPFRTLGRAHQAVDAGRTIWMLPGTYEWSATVTLTKSGTDGSPIVLSGTPGDRPLIDFESQPRGSSNRGIEIEGNYWYVRSLEVANAGDNGIAISGSHNVVEDVVLHHCEDTGLQITVNSSQAGNDAYGADNLILNCDSYENFDQQTGGENADGFAAKLRIGPGNVFRGCRAWNNADDGWDLFASNDVVVIEDCWAFSNGKVDGQNPQGDGNGFKLGGAPNGTDQGGAVHLVRRNAAFENRACGFTRNNNPEQINATDCAVRDNPNGDFCVMSCSPTSSVSLTAQDAKIAPRSSDGSLPSVQ